MTNFWIRWPHAAAAALAGGLIAAGSLCHDTWLPNMTPHHPRIEAAFASTKTICFGRLMIDVPERTQVVWGNADVPLGVSVYPDGVKHVVDMAVAKRDELAADTIAPYLGGGSMFIGSVSTAEPAGRIITGHRSFSNPEDLVMNGYFAIDTYGVVIAALPATRSLSRAEGLIRSIAKRLRPYGNDLPGMPQEPGLCIGNAFLPDETGVDTGGFGELVAAGFRLEDFPDVHLSIQLSPADPHRDEGNTLKFQLEKLDKRSLMAGQFPPLSRITYLRRGERQINDWPDGYEGLSRTPEEPESRSHHDFAMDVQGISGEGIRPYLDIRMASGVDRNAAGAVAPSITDDEAIALWDRLTASIRPRPTASPPVSPASSAR